MTTFRNIASASLIVLQVCAAAAQSDSTPPPSASYFARLRRGPSNDKGLLGAHVFVRNSGGSRTPGVVSGLDPEHRRAFLTDDDGTTHWVDETEIEDVAAPSDARRSWWRFPFWGGSHSGFANVNKWRRNAEPPYGCAASLPPAPQAGKGAVRHRAAVREKDANPTQDNSGGFQVRKCPPPPQ
jgi:hypothetical protein